MRDEVVRKLADGPGAGRLGQLGAICLLALVGCASRPSYDAYFRNGAAVNVDLVDVTASANAMLCHNIAPRDRCKFALSTGHHVLSARVTGTSVAATPTSSLDFDAQPHEYHLELTLRYYPFLYAKYAKAGQQDFGGYQLTLQLSP